MSIPREASRDTGDGILVSICPDVCLTPAGSSYVPIPYSITAKQSDDANTCPTVRGTGKRLHTMGSIITKCSGDAPGTGKGVKSGTVESVCHPKEHSSSVRACGQYVIRHNDVWYMNNKNTVGKLTYVKDTEVDQLTPPIYHADKDDGAPGEASSPAIMSDASPAPLVPGERYAFLDTGNPQPAPDIKIPGTEPKTAPSNPPTREVPKVPNNNNIGPAKNVRWWSRLLPWLGRASPAAAQGALAGGVGYIGVKRAEGLADAYNPITGEIGPRTPFFGTSIERLMREDRLRLQQQLEQARKDFETQTQLEEEKDTVPQTGLSPGNARVSGTKKRKKPPCKTGRYGSLKCPGQQAHHIVPDYALRYGTRAEGVKGVKRIPGLPSFRDGPAICLSGYASRAGDEHSIAHSADEEIAKLGGSSGVAPISEITKLSREGAIRARPDCKKEILKALAAQPSLFSNTQARTTIEPPHVWPPR